MKKIGIVLSSAPAYSETFLVSKIRHLQNSGNEIYLFVDNYKSNSVTICPTYVGLQWNKGWLGRTLQLVRSFSRLLFNLPSAIRLWKENAKNQFDKKNNFRSLLISSHILGKRLDWLHFGFATMALGRENLAKVIGAKMAVSARGYDLCVYPIKHPGCYDLLWQRIDKFHHISGFLLDLAIKDGFSSRIGSHALITPAIDTTVFANDHLKPIKKGDYLVFTTVGRLHWIKGYHYVFEALSIIKHRGISFKYKIVGEGVEFEHLKFLADQLGISEEVSFLGKLSQGDIRQHLLETDIYIQYSLQEGFCNATLEAQAMGCLCVVSDADGLSENVLNGITGFVVQKRNPERLYQKIVEILALPNVAIIQMKKAAVFRVREKFNLEKQSALFTDFYN